MSGVLLHNKPGVVAISGSFTGASTPVIVAGKGSFTVARTGSTTSTVYTVTLNGTPPPKAQQLVVVLTFEDATADQTTEKYVLNLKNKSASAGTFSVQASTAAGVVGPADDAAVINFAAFLHTASDTAF